MLNIIEKLYIHSELSIVYMHYWGYNGGIQYLLVNLVWDTVFTSEYSTGYSINW